MLQVQPSSREASQEAFADLVQQVELAGYYPELVLDTLRLAVGEEEILSGMVQAETTFAEAVHRHLTVLALTPSRLIIVHVDDTPGDDGSPGALATSEAVPLSRIRSMALTRGVVDPAQGGGTLILERFVTAARHVETQCARDSHGEGAVLTDATGRMVKVKSDRYLALTRFRTAVTRVWQGTADHLPADMADVENALRRTRRWHRLPAYTATGPVGRPALDIPALLDGLPPAGPTS